MKKQILILATALTIVFFFSLVRPGWAQNVGINTLAPDVSAILELQSTDKGLLIPRVSLDSITDVTTIPSPALSLIVFNTNDLMVGGTGIGFYYWDGTQWMQALGPQGPQGPAGADGAQGPQGPAGVGPPGVIVMWSGLNSNIPAGWALCDGTNGTPDLTDKFILSVSSSAENPGATGGSHSYSLTLSQVPAHTHTFTTNSGGSHTHAFTTNSAGAHVHSFFCNDPNPGNGLTGVVRGDNNCGTANSPDPNQGIHTHTGTTNPDGTHTLTGTTDATGSGSSIDNRPAYYKLAYIMKL